MSSTVVITGSSGFIGSALVRTFSEAGWNVVALRRRPEEAPPLERVVWKRYRLGESLDVYGDVLIHCAHEPESNGNHARALNVSGTERLIADARSRGISKFVFLSSLAAMEQAKSSYGEDKYRLEMRLDLRSDLVIRPGLVIGNGGLFRAMMQTIQNARIAPVFRGGKQPVYTIALGDLCSAIYRLVDSGYAGAYTLASPEPIELKRLFAALADRLRIPLRLIPLPYRPTLWLARLAEILGVRPPISSESVRGLQNLRYLNIPEYPELGAPFKPFQDALRELKNS